jgi:endonuclease-3 related protein
MLESSSARILRIIRYLEKKYGMLDWWQGNTDEVMIGAILTQQTRWENVKRALAALKEQGLCSMEAIFSADPEILEQAIQCTGFYRIKTQRLKSLAAHVMCSYGSIELMADEPTDKIREQLIGVNGIGEETADSILCYGFQRPSFIIDAYTERICQCVGLGIKRAPLKVLFEAVLPHDPMIYRQVHAHIVEYAKEYCVKKRCGECTLVSLNG